MVVTLYASNTGRITCREHGGAYLNAYLEVHPKARRFVTPLDHWERVSLEDREAWAAELGEPMRCEVCREAERDTALCGCQGRLEV